MTGPLVGGVRAAVTAARRVSIAFTVGLLKDSSGSVEGIFAVMRDDTERWETEKQLRKRVAELEQGVARDPRS
jgi:signal transduction histidine kinase